MSRELIDQQKMTEQEVLDTLLEWWLTFDKDVIIRNIHLEIIKDSHIYKQQWINNEMRQACVDVLDEQRNRTDQFEAVINNENVYMIGKYCEVLSVYKIGDYANSHMTFYGSDVSVQPDVKQLTIMRSCNDNQLIKVHNHPSGGGPQIQDFRQFSKMNSVATQIVVTNHGKIFIISKTEKFRSDDTYKEIVRIQYSKLSNRDKVLEVLKMSRQLGIAIKAITLRGVIVWM